ncbi:MAG: rubrerythrin family protein [Fusobacteriota bacterium]
MDKKKRLMSEAIKLEWNMSKLYEILSEKFKEDSEFFWELSKEEVRHASLIKSIEKYFINFYGFPSDLLPLEVEKLEESNGKIESLIKKIEKESIPRKIAFNKALELENAAGELHFQEFLDMKKDSKLHKIFIRLNKEDRDHSKRIKKYMNENDIKING